MPKLLYIESSPRKERSHSIAVAEAFLGAYRAKHPDVEVETWDLWAEGEQLPQFDGAAITARYNLKGGAGHTASEAEAWRMVTATAERLKSADVLLFGVPMWNFGVPYKLKHLIDVVTQPGLTFGYDPAKGFLGLMPTKLAVVVSARGGVYAEDAPAAAMNLQTPYMRTWLGFIGVKDVRELVVEGTGGGGEAEVAAAEKATAQAREMGGTL